MLERLEKARPINMHQKFKYIVFAITVKLDLRYSYSVLQFLKALKR